MPPAQANITHLSRAKPTMPSSISAGTLLVEVRGDALLPSITDTVLGARVCKRAGSHRPPGGSKAHTWRSAWYSKHRHARDAYRGVLLATVGMRLKNNFGWTSHQSYRAINLLSSSRVEEAGEGTECTMYAWYHKRLGLGAKA